ncbi:MAG: FecR domain-containing protein [Leptospiraceae bacterium]|nr:FecR domain-containing protein [Leptospiraceae bacterium]
MAFSQELTSKAVSLLDSTKFVISFLLFVLISSSFLLYRNMTRIVKVGDNPVIGTLTFKKHKAQRKYDSQVIWGELEAKSYITNRDTIRTEDKSDAVVTLKDGTKIALAENSMVYLDFSDKDININFAYGSISANKSDGNKNSSVLNIKSGDLAVQVTSAGDLQMSKTTEEKVQVKMASGEAKLIQDGQEKTVKKNEAMEVKTSTEETKQIVKLEDKPLHRAMPKVEEERDIVPDVKPIFPLRGFQYTSNEPLTLEWEANPDAQEYLLELVEISPEGNKSLIKEELSSSSYTISDTGALSGGEFIWSITAIKKKRNGEKIYSVPVKNQFSVMVTGFGAPKILSPKKIYVD